MEQILIASTNKSPLKITFEVSYLPLFLVPPFHGSESRGNQSRLWTSSYLVEMCNMYHYIVQIRHTAIVNENINCAN
jgi:hypothetical protein